MTKTSPISSFLKGFYENIRLFNKLYYFKKWRLKDQMKQDNRLFNRILKYMGKDYDQEIENEGSRLKKGDLIEIEFTDDDLKAIYDSMEGINYENLLKFENRYFLLLIYSEMEQYLFKSFKYVLTIYPAILKEKSIPLNKLLDNNQTINSIIEEKIEKELHDLLYNNFFEVFRYASIVLKIIHQIGKDDIKKLNEFRQVRNLYTHGDGKINTLFLSKVRDSNFKLGEEMIINTDQLQIYLDLIFKILIKFDKIFIKKFPELITDKAFYSLTLTKVEDLDFLQ